VCDVAFTVADDVLTRFPGWTPRFCMQHRGGNQGRPATGGSSTPSSTGSRDQPTRLPPARAAGSTTFRSTRLGNGSATLSPTEVLERYHGGPQSGVFTDGGCSPNPGPGGWGFVHVQDGVILAEASGGDRATTNNRMEMSAIIAALRALPVDARVTLYSDSDLCVKTLTQWAKGWAARGWRKKDGEVKNLDLVQEAWALVQARPGVRLQWVKAHDGTRWNEYVDALATQARPG
jgi:ribonuclease HI